MSFELAMYSHPVTTWYLLPKHGDIRRAHARVEIELRAGRAHTR